VAQILGSELSLYITDNYGDILRNVRHLGKGVCEVDDMLNDILLSSYEEFIDLSKYGDGGDRAIKYINGRIKNKVGEEIKRQGSLNELDDNMVGNRNLGVGQGIQKRNKKVIQGDISSLEEFWEVALAESFIDCPIGEGSIYEGTLEPLTYNKDSENPRGSNANNMLVAVYIYGQIQGELVEGLYDRVSLDLEEIKGKLNFNERFSSGLVNQLKGVAELLSIGIVGTGTFLLDTELVGCSEERARNLVKCFDCIFSRSAGGSIKKVKVDKSRSLLRALKLMYIFHGVEGGEECLYSALRGSYIGTPMQELRLVDISIVDVDINMSEFLVWVGGLFYVESTMTKAVITFKQSQGTKAKEALKWEKITHINFFGRHLNISEIDYISIQRG
jgi:hypothetical protein